MTWRVPLQHASIESNLQCSSLSTSDALNGSRSVPVGFKRCAISTEITKAPPCNAQDQTNAASLSQFAWGPDQYWWQQDKEGTAARSYQEEPNETKADTTSNKVCPTPHLFLKPIMNHVS